MPKEPFPSMTDRITRPPSLPPPLPIDGGRRLKRPEQRNEGGPSLPRSRDYSRLCGGPRLVLTCYPRFNILPPFTANTNGGLDSACRLTDWLMEALTEGTLSSDRPKEVFIGLPVEISCIKC